MSSSLALPLAQCASSMCKKSIREQGFTLIELIVVIVIVSILAVMGFSFAIKIIDSYESTQRRALILNSARPALERITRQLRGALPYSVKVTNSGACVEFFPIAAGGNYFSPVPDSENGAAATSSISVSPYVVEFGNASFVSIGAMSESEIYGSAAGSRAGFSTSSTATTILLTSPKIWQRNSINQRFYLLDKPQAFCLVGDELRSYAELDATLTSVDTSGDYAILAKGVSSNQPFAVELGSEVRNTQVLMDLRFTQRGESMDFLQGVMIRNVP